MITDSMADTSRQINPRISVSTFDKLEMEAQKRNLSITALAGKILEDHVDKRALKEERGDIIMGKKILRYLLQSSNNSKQDEFESSIKKAADEILTEWKLQVGEITFKEFDKRMLEWHKLNQLKIRSIHSDNQHVQYMIKHDLGPSWSEFQCKLYCKILEELGNVVVSSHFDDLSFTIEVPYQENH